MAKYVAKRFVSMLITLFMVATVTFFLMHAVPGQPFEITRETPDSVKEALYEQYGLNKPLLEQYVIYMKNLLHQDPKNLILSSPSRKPDSSLLQDIGYMEFQA